MKMKEMPPKLEESVRERIYGCLQRAKSTCRQGLPRIIGPGVVEDDDDAKRRRKAEVKLEDKIYRHYQRRKTVSSMPTNVRRDA